MLNTVGRIEQGTSPHIQVMLSQNEECDILEFFPWYFISLPKLPFLYPAILNFNLLACNVCS